MRGIVTGASRGLGLALTRALSERGWQLAVDARGAEALEHAVAGLSGVIAVTGDVADPDHRRRLVEAAGEPIDLLVNNASLLGPSPLTLLARYPLGELRRCTRRTCSRRWRWFSSPSLVSHRTRGLSTSFPMQLPRRTRRGVGTARRRLLLRRSPRCWIGRGDHDRVRPEVDEQTHLTLRHAAGDRDDEAAEAFGAVERARPGRR